ncbi:MAG: chemotaxis protein CheA [Deltaproteobacteria bacterium]|nr:MAG: chemotaxis protein CheA [Deltaproteobacteria bacterium]
MAKKESKISKKALQEFQSEAEEIVEKLYHNIVDLEESSKKGKVDPDSLNDTFRAAHSLKGVAGMFGFSQIEALSHNLESILDSLRLGKIQLEPEIFALLDESVGLLSKIIGASGKEGAEEKDQIEALIGKLDQRFQEYSSSEKASPLEELKIDESIISVLTEYEEHRLLENIREGINIFRVRAGFDLQSFDQGLAELNQLLKPLGEIITTLPSSSGVADSEINFDIILGTKKDRKFLENTIEWKNVSFTQIETGKVEKEEEASPEKLKPGEGSAEEEGLSLKSISQTVRVDINKLDNIMNIVGELLLSKAVISELTERLRMEKGFSGVAVDFYKANRGLERKLNELQEGVMEVRMVPLHQIFEKLSRVIRKLTKDSGKEVELEISGADTELDKLIVEALGDPLIHIIRNCLDHGIETPEERKRKGKPKKGTIKINAFPKGNHVVIEVEDDGSGIDLTRISEVVVEKGLIEPGIQLGKEELLEFLFMPGFSTKKEISKISGRGVGLDVVKSNISSMSGMIRIESEENKGAKVILTLPITLAIIKALIITTCGRTYAIPLNSIQESLMITSQEIKTVEGREVIQLRDQTLSLLRLNHLFALPGESPSVEQYFVVVVSLAERRLGILVEGLLGQQDVVVKSIGEPLVGVRGIGGATELGNKTTVLVLDVGGLIEESMRL